MFGRIRIEEHCFSGHGSGAMKELLSEEFVHSDDLNAHGAFPEETSNKVIKANLILCEGVAQVGCGQPGNV